MTTSGATDLPTKRLLACLDELAELDSTQLSAAGQADLLVVLGRAEAKLAAVRLRVLSAADKNNTAMTCGAADTGQWAAKVARLDQVTTHRQVGLARGLEARPAPARRSPRVSCQPSTPR